MMKSIRRFFLVCSGATVEILERPECKTEVARYAMMGAFVVLDGRLCFSFRWVRTVHRIQESTAGDSRRPALGRVHIYSR